MAMWVWRLSGKVDPGNRLLYLDPKPNDYEGTEFQCRLLRDNHQLSQGWGFPTLYLELPLADWIRYYIDICNPFDPNNPHQVLPVFRQLVEDVQKELRRQGLPRAKWGDTWAREDPTWTRQEATNNANKDHQLLSPILDIRPGDTIFVPKANLNGRSEDHFIVVTAAGRYQLIDRRNDQQFGHQRRWTSDFHSTEDFGHVIPVDGNWTQVFNYGDTIRGSFFQGYQKRVNRVENRDKINTLIGFLNGLTPRYPCNPC